MLWTSRDVHANAKAGAGMMAPPRFTPIPAATELYKPHLPGAGRVICVKRLTVSILLVPWARHTFSAFDWPVKRERLLSKN